jgi:hypothetical protein
VENARVTERKPPVVPRNQKIPDPIKKNSTMMMKAVYYDFGKKQENCTHFSEVISGEG